MKGLRDIDVMSLGQKRLMGARLFQVRFAAFLGQGCCCHSCPSPCTGGVHPHYNFLRHKSEHQ